MLMRWILMVFFVGHPPLLSVLTRPIDVAYTRAWPTSTPQAAEALAAASDSHHVEPLLAYDINSVLIEPQYYMRRLDGATVILQFELSHHLIRKQGKPPVDTFSARVVQIRVILPPPGVAPATPRKKRVLPRDDYFGSFMPTKRGQDDNDNDNDKENVGPRKLMRWAIFRVPSRCLC